MFWTWRCNQFLLLEKTAFKVLAANVITFTFLTRQLPEYNDEDIVILPADKGRVSAVMDKTEYLISFNQSCALF